MNREDFIDKYFINIKLSSVYFDLYYVRKSIFKAIASNLHVFEGVVLDVGCGIMPYREHLLDNNDKITRYIGLDFEMALDEEYALGKPDLFWKGDIIPVDSGSIDAIIATEFFEHCPDPEKVMIEMERVLKPGGVIFFTVPFVWNLHLSPYDEYRYTPFSLRRHLSNAGFHHIKLDALGRWDASLAQMIAIWYHNRPMRKIYKTIFGHFVKGIIKMLIEEDEKFDKRDFERDGVMITGLSGLAYKKES